jgi:acetyl esterase/lipase
LSPEASYPDPLDDCLAGFEWVVAHADELGIDPERVGVGGRSAGGGLAAGLALLLRDQGRSEVRFQILIHPMLDDRMETQSASWDDPMWPPEANRFGWRAYLGALEGDDVPAYAAAARAADLSGLPPTYLSVGGLDAFSDSVIAYASRLRHSGVSTDLHVFADVPHGFDSLAPGTAVARRAVAALDEWLATRLGDVPG